MVGLSIGCGSLVGRTKTSSVGRNEMHPTIYNCIKNLAPRTRERDPRVNGVLRPPFASQAVALFCGVVE
jgi:hypothetical protein